MASRIWKKDRTGLLIDFFQNFRLGRPKIGSGSPEIKQYGCFFQGWNWSFNRDFLKKKSDQVVYRTGRLIETLEYILLFNAGTVILQILVIFF